MHAFHEEHAEYTRGLLSYTLEYIVTNTWPTNSLASDYNDCDMSCEVGQTEPCGCTCTVDPYDWSDDEVCAANRPAYFVRHTYQILIKVRLVTRIFRPH